jgi:thiamine kinase-like enzyme
VIARSCDEIRINNLIKQAAWDRNSVSFTHEPIGGTNTSYFVEYEGARYVIRIAASDSSILSINRKAEYEAVKIASSIGIGATLVFFDVTNGDMITHFHPGQMPTVEDIQKPYNLGILTQVLKKLHMGNIKHHFKPYEDVQVRLTYLENKSPVTLESDVLTQAKKKYEMTVANPPHGINNERYLGLCHNDPCVNNMLHSDKLLLIDYEFAGMGNVFFDIASICGQWSIQLKKEFLKCYFGYFAEFHIDYINYYTIVQLIWNATWGYVKSCGEHSVSIDYISWANEQCSIALSI